jgi:RNA polymerase sigma-70 factor (ECF subfamily)
MYKRHVADVYRYALAVMRNPADAEDVTQTTFLNAYRSYVEKGNQPEKPQNWLIAIAHNVCRQRFRQSARRPAEVSFEDDIADSIDEDEVPSGEDIRRALGHLAFNQRAALVMRELEGRSYAEIAELLELSTSAVETLIFRARRALREQLEGTLTCGEAEFAISLQLDGRLSRQQKGQLRAHLRECGECATFARRQRAQRGALKSLALVPVPSSLTSFFGGGTTGTALAVKAAAGVTAGLLVGGAGYEGVRHAPWHDTQPAAATPNQQVVAEVPPNAFVPSPREHIPRVTVRTSRAERHSAGTRAAFGHSKEKAGHGALRGRKLGHQKSAAGRHAVPPPHPLHPTHPSHPAHPVHPAAPAKAAVGQSKANVHPAPATEAATPSHAKKP